MHHHRHACSCYLDPTRNVETQHDTEAGEGTRVENKDVQSQKDIR